MEELKKGISHLKINTMDRYYKVDLPFEITKDNKIKAGGKILEISECYLQPDNNDKGYPIAKTNDSAVKGYLYVKESVAKENGMKIGEEYILFKKTAEEKRKELEEMDKKQ